MRPVWVVIDTWSHYLHVHRVKDTSGPGEQGLLIGDVVEVAREFETGRDRFASQQEEPARVPGFDRAWRRCRHDRVNEPRQHADGSLPHVLGTLGRGAADHRARAWRRLHGGDGGGGSGTVSPECARTGPDSTSPRVPRAGLARVRPDRPRQSPTGCCCICSSAIQRPGRTREPWRRHSAPRGDGIEAFAKRSTGSSMPDMSNTSGDRTPRRPGSAATRSPPKAASARRPSPALRTVMDIKLSTAPARSPFSTVSGAWHVAR